LRFFFSKNVLLFENNVVSLQRISNLTFNIMARKSREKSATGVYHVMMRGTNKQNIFEETDDYIRFISILRSMVYPIDDMRKPLPSRCHFYAYCLMTNHVIITTINTSDVDTSFKTVLRVNP